MGRRALPKIDPSLDLSGYLKPLEELPLPLDPQTLFSRKQPLEIEVGSGKGLFLRNASAAHPERNFLGVEIARQYVRYCAAKLAVDERENALMIRGDAKRLFFDYLPPACCVAVHVYFPDPWWKKRHKKRRVMTASFVQAVERVLEPNGKLHFWTDVEEYYHATLELLSTSCTLKGPLTPEEKPAEHEFDYRTHFERRMRRHDRPVYRAEYRKRN